MPDKILTFLRQNAIALCALFIALGGTGYAALTINGNQIRNHTITPVKFSRSAISASIRAWAIIYGGITSVTPGPASSGIRVRTFGTGEQVSWPRQRFGTNCLPMATPFGAVAAGGYGSVTITDFEPKQATIDLHGFGPDKVGRPQPIYLVVICP